MQGFDVQHRWKVGVAELDGGAEVPGLFERVGGGAEEMVGSPADAGLSGGFPVFLESLIFQRVSFRGFEDDAGERADFPGIPDILRGPSLGVDDYEQGVPDNPVVVMGDVQAVMMVS